MSDLGPLAGLVGAWEGAKGIDTAPDGDGSTTYGICSRFLDLEFKTVRYALGFDMRSEDPIHYREDTVLQIRGQDVLFHHTDENNLSRVA